MARGFESKSVADQQEEAQRVRAPKNEDAPDPVRLAKLRKLELSRADVMRRLEAATSDGHREMLRRALKALEKDLAKLE
jgi:hypothetical protein